MKMFVRAFQFVELAMWPVFGCLVFLLFVFTSFGRRNPKLADIGPIVLILGGVVLSWVGYVAWRWRFLRKMANPSVVDTSMSLVPLPDGLAGAAAELQRLGFTLLGQYTVATAWAEGPTRVYAMYVSPENPDSGPTFPTPPP